MNDETNIKMRELFRVITEKNLSRDIFQWLSEKISLVADASEGHQLNITFTSIPRRTGKDKINLLNSDVDKMHETLPGFSLQGWTIDRLARVWLITGLNPNDKSNYIRRIENLFPQAERNEQVALYSALPFLYFPEDWQLQCASGIRSNIDDVLEAIMYHNPYAAAYLEEPAWNQMVMKAFFTGKNINNITGVDTRVNRALANMLFDYVAERWAAHRLEDKQIWRLTGKYLDEDHIYMIKKLFSGKEVDQQAAALACAESSSPKAKKLLEKYPAYKEAIEKQTLTWQTIAGLQNI